MSSLVEIFSLGNTSPEDTQVCRNAFFGGNRHFLRGLRKVYHIRDRYWKRVIFIKNPSDWDQADGGRGFAHDWDMRTGAEMAMEAISQLMAKYRMTARQIVRAFDVGILLNSNERFFGDNMAHLFTRIRKD